MSFDLHPIQLTEAKWQAVRAKFAAEGIDVPDEANGEIERDNIKAQFTWDGKTLRITIVKKPFYYPESTVTKHLSEFITTA